MVGGWYLHFLQTPVVISRKQWFHACVHWRAGILDLRGAECGCMWLACNVTWWATLLSRLLFVSWEIVSRRFMSMLAYLMWCVILRSSDMPHAWSQTLLWRTHPFIKLVVTVTFVMNKVEGSWARPWLKKNNFCFCRGQKCYVRLTDMVCFQKLGILIDSDSIFRPLH